MRSLVGSLFLSSLFMQQLGCGDSGGDSTAGGTTNPVITSVSGTTDGATGEPTGGETEAQPTGGAGTQTTGGSQSGTDTNATTGTSDGPSTETGPSSATDGTGQLSATEPGTSDGETTTSTTGVEMTTGDGSTTTGDTSTTGEPDMTTGDVPCQVQMATLKPVVPNMMLVLDKSGSMLTKFNDKVNFGANLFPSKSAQQVYDASACPVSASVEVKVKAKNKAAILGAIPPADNNTIAGGTPAAAGMTAALNHLKTLPADVPRAVLLVTDGAANCTSGAMGAGLFEVYDQSVHTIVQTAFNVDKIPTYVIGINTLNMVTPVLGDGNPDGINPFAKLNELATLGGTPKNDPNEKVYNADNQIELAAALGAVIADALSCVIPLDSEPAKPELTEVKINGAEVPHIDNCGNQSGWKYTNPNGPYDAIELCGTACNNLKQLGKADVNFFCVPN